MHILKFLAIFIVASIGASLVIRQDFPGWETYLGVVLGTGLTWYFKRGKERTNSEEWWKF